ncbi:M-phase phosphoprotein 6 [Galleria mellonella]|uniref:M-phase phosphoprotein 6 n=1 Tax=Galleria mellonella TaxID=7137 RepID=A0ABM3MVY5_GALME|nr:M-phase phosphoprotein 6 [Galleria mellonella]
MANYVKKKLQLPKSVLDMKFMKKTKDRIEREIENTQDHDGLYSNIITNEMRHATGNFITETSFIVCEDLLEGRLSYKGMNPEIERLMELESKKQEPAPDMQKDISDEILAKKMQSFNNRKRSYNSPSKYNVIKRKK